jgi:diaminopimelate decarboxylase
MTSAPHPAARQQTVPTAWWTRDDLRYRKGSLCLGTQDLGQLAASAGGPVYAYHGDRIRSNLSRLQGALREHARGARVFYAMKANRFPPVLSLLHATGRCGIDACSPGELMLARSVGFPEEAISYTSTSVSDDDLAVLRRHPGVWINCDSLSSLRRLGESMPGREIGLRINPGVGVGYRSNRLVRYAGATATKFGIYAAEFPEALRIAGASGLRVTGLHVHAGCGYLTPQLPSWEKILGIAADFAAQAPTVRRLNIGGGLGIPLVAGDAPLDLDAWGRIIARTIASRGVQVWVEPGDYLVKDSGALVLQINTVERKRGTWFIGVNGGFDMHPEPAFYGLPLVPVPCRAPGSGRLRMRRVTIAGNINEALDLLAENVSLPPLAEGERLAFLNAGGYGAAMSSRHCLRGEFTEYLV